MNKPVIVFTSWKRQDTNGNTMLAPVSGPHDTPSRAAHDVACTSKARRGVCEQCNHNNLIQWEPAERYHIVASYR